jgi:sterol desaturase/sphingolipid hydroxylase (fatty acid hydroxylase superfamily)
MIGIPLGLAYANASEWVVHKYVLHGMGRRRRSFFAFHWLEHHRVARLKGFRDPDYERPLLSSGWNAQTKEAVAVTAAALAHLPLFPVAPFFTGTVLYSAWNYYRKHRRAHLDPAWAREHLPWHYDHHMAPNQDANWCVTKPWFDHLLGTRAPYVGTERERRDRERAGRRRARRRARADAVKQAA